MFFQRNTHLPSWFFGISELLREAEQNLHRATGAPGVSEESIFEVRVFHFFGRIALILAFTKQTKKKKKDEEERNTLNLS